jgi:hypothetical protein
MTIMIDLDYPGSEARAAALLMLMWARSQGPDSTLFGRDAFQLLPWQVIFRRADAITTLEGVRKPIMVIAVRRECPSLALWPTEEFVQWSAVVPISERLSLALEASRRRKLPGRSSRNILFVSRDERLLVGSDDVEAWSRDYVVNLADFSVGESTEEEGNLGAVVTVTLLESRHLIATSLSPIEAK